MQGQPPSRLCGALVVILAALLILSRVLGLLGLPELFPEAERMGLFNMIMMGCAGFAIAALATPWPRLRAVPRAAVLACIAVLALLPLGFLAESLFNISLGIDLPGRGVLPSPLIAHPGRTSPNGAVAFLCIDIALLCLLSPRRRLRASVGFVATLVVGAIGIAALIGHALGLQDLYRLAGYNRLLPATAVAMCLCAGGLWTLLEPGAALGGRPAVDAERQINRRSAGLFALVAVIGGVAGFAVLRSSFEDATARNLLLTARTTATLVASEIEASLWYPKVIVARSSVRTAMRQLSAGQPGMAARAAALDAMSRLAERYFNEQVTGAQFLDARGETVFSSGTLSIKGASVKHALRGAGGGAVLFWADGYVLETRNDIVADGRMVGTLVVETRLPRIHALLGEVQESGPTTDTVLCGRSGAATFSCGPSRLHRQGLSESMRADGASVAGTLALALGGASGTRLVADAAAPSAFAGSGANVIAAYTPVKDFGLALAVRSDVESLYAPLRGRVLELLLVLAAVVAAGTLILRSQLRPLVAALGRAQRRTARILENSNDAFIALDEHGAITDWNAQAVRLFGWSAGEALGQTLSTLILPPDSRAAFASAIDHVEDGGPADPDGASRRIELDVLARDGRRCAVEMSLKTEHTGDGYLAHVFVQDISARKAARDALRHSEQRLRLIANNLPALVSYIDRDFRYVFVNNQYQRWFGLPEGAVAGKTVAEVFGAATFENVRARIASALAGEHVSFDLVNDIEGAPPRMQVHYIPDRDAHGTVIGVFGMVLDQTAQHSAQERVEASERQLRAVTDSLPILISYIDAGEKLRFLNGTFRDWLGVDLQAAIGRPLIDVVGPEIYGQRRRQLQLALAGQRQEFDVESRTMAGRRHLHTVYTPDLREDGSTRGVFTVSMDVTRLKLVEEELRALSGVDTLTGLPNRRQLGERLDLALAHHQREQTPLALMFLDIDHFKTINDSLGHAAGDGVLQQFAERLGGAVRDADTVARLGGDEFIVLLENVGSAHDAAQVADKILAAVRRPFETGNGALAVTTSVGIAVSLGGARHGRPHPGGVGASAAVSREALMEAADRALYRAKQAGRDRYELEVLDAAPTLP